MAKRRVGHREAETLRYIHERGYLLVPGESGKKYDLLVEKGLVARTVVKQHKTLKSQTTIVDIYRIELTDLGRRLVEVDEPEVEDAEVVELREGVEALFLTYEEGDAV